MAKENEFSKTFEEWYEWWFNKPFPTDEKEIEDLKADDCLRTVYEYTFENYLLKKKLKMQLKF